MRYAALLLFCLFLGAMSASAGEAQTTCPISGKPVNGDYYADVDGFRVFTVGEAEADAVRKDPAKAFARLARAKEAAVPVVWVCPSMMNPVGPEYPFVQKDGKRIYYCCRPCQPRIANNFKQAAATMKRLAEERAG